MKPIKRNAMESPLSELMGSLNPSNLTVDCVEAIEADLQAAKASISYVMPSGACYSKVSVSVTAGPESVFLSIYADFADDMPSDRHSLPLWPPTGSDDWTDEDWKTYEESDDFELEWFDARIHTYMRGGKDLVDLMRIMTIDMGNMWSTYDILRNMFMTDPLIIPAMLDYSITLAKAKVSH